MKEIAQGFGITLDNDDFAETAKLISDDCQYIIGDEVLIGAVAICDSYEQNMLEGRRKLDKLVWGKSRIEVIGANEFYVHFTDYLTHKGQDYTHRCKQKLTISDEMKIVRIEHIQDEDESQRLKSFYKKVGL